VRRDTHLSFDEYYCLYINDLLSLKVCLVVSFVVFVVFSDSAE
jgi:hypothetical protein